MANLLLDTHAFLWWLADDRRLKHAARMAIAEAPVVYISSVSAWEAGIKAALGRLTLLAPFHEDVSACGFEELPITMAHAERAGGLPPHHKDPFDRMLIAQATTESLSLVTHDRSFEPYGVKVLWT